MGPLKRTILRGGRAQLAGELPLAHQDEGGGAGGVALELVAQAAVEGAQVVHLADAVAIGGVRHDQGALGQAGEVEVAGLDPDPGRHSRGTEIAAGGGDRGRVEVAGEDHSAAGRVRARARSRRRASSAGSCPGHRSQAKRRQSRRRAGGDQRRLHRQGAVPHMGSEQGLRAVVAGQEEDAGGQGLGKRRRAARGAVAAVGQRLPEASRLRTQTRAPDGGGGRGRPGAVDSGAHPARGAAGLPRRP